MDIRTIRDLVLDAERHAEDERIPFAATPWVASSAVIWREDDGTAPVEHGGTRYEYFLEPAIIAEVKEGFELPDDELVERVIRYARDDA